MPSGYGATVRSVIESTDIPSAILNHAALIYAIRGDFVDITSGRITRMIDQGPHGNHWVESGANGPTYSATAINGLPGGRVTGGSNDLQNATIGTLMTAGEIFTVAKRDVDPPASGTTSGFCLFQAHIGGDTYVPFSDGVIYDGWGSTARKVTVNPTPALTNPFLYNVTSKSAGWTSRLNGVQIFTTGTNTVSFAATKFLWAGGGSSKLVGNIAESIMFSAELSADDRALVTTYLMNRYGIT